MTGYLRANLPVFSFVLCILAVGFVFGVLSVRNLDSAQQEEIVQHLNFFLDDFSGGLQLEGSMVARETVLANIRFLGLMWFLGLIIIGLPVVILLIFIRGFALGFTTSFLIESMQLQGVFFSLISLVPQNIFFVPAIIVTASSALKFGLAVVRKKPLRMRSVGEGFFSYSTLVLLCCIMVFAGALVEAYLSPRLIHYYARYFS